MATYAPFKLTNDGRDLEYNAQLAKTLKFTTFKLGSGTYAGSISDLHALVEPKMDAKITRLQITGDTTKRKVIIGFDLNNNDVSEGFYLREIGIFAEDPNTQEEKLVFYTNAGDDADYIAPKGSTTVLEKLFNAELYISDVESITAEIDTSLSYVTQSDFTSSIQSITTDLSNAEADISELQSDTYRKNETYSKEEVDSKLVGAYIYKGSVPNKEELPKQDQKNGDVYNIEDTGMNVAWNGNDWDDLGSVFDAKYTSLTDKPSINNVTIEGSKQCEDYGIQRSINYVANQVLTVEAWMADGESYYQLVQLPNVTTNHRANVYLDLANQQKLVDGYTETVTNGVKIITSEKPTEEITCNIEVALMKTS